MLKIQLVIDQNPVYHRYAFAYIQSLLKFGGIKREQIILRTALFHMEKDDGGREILRRYKHMRIPVSDFGLLQHGHFNKLQPVEWCFGEDPNTEIVLQCDPDTRINEPIDLNKVTEKLCAIKGLNVAWYDGSNDAASQIVQPERRKLRIRDLESCGVLGDVRYDILIRHIFGISHQQFLEWAQESKSMWVYGGCVWYRRGVLSTPAWKKMFDMASFTHCDEVLLKLGECTGTLPGILRLKNYPILNGKPVHHEVCPHPLQFDRNWTHYASLQYRKQYQSTLDAMLAKAETELGFPPLKI